jgi:hypothetical protein
MLGWQITAVNVRSYMRIIAAIVQHVLTAIQGMV